MPYPILGNPVVGVVPRLPLAAGSSAVAGFVLFLAEILGRCDVKSQPQLTSVLGGAGCLLCSSFRRQSRVPIGNERDRGV